jgi:hypothetical protein
MWIDDCNMFLICHEEGTSLQSYQKPPNPEIIFSLFRLGVFVSFGLIFSLYPARDAASFSISLQR